MAGMAVGPPLGSQGPTAQDLDAERKRRAQSAYDEHIAQQRIIQANQAGISGSTSGVDAGGNPYNYATGGAGGGGSRTPGGGGGGAPVPTQPISPGAADPYLPKIIPRDPLPARITPPNPADRSAAEAAAYGRAKDQIGRSTAGAVSSLQRVMGARGLGGSGLAGRGIASLLARGSGELGDVSRDQAIQGLQRDYAEADRNYAGDLSQRATDVGFTTTQRGQDISQEQGRAGMIPGILALLRRSQTGAAY